MKPELHDELLERELRRRTGGTWQPERVLSAVRRGMELRPERVFPRPRWAPLAGLLGVLGVLVVLAVALPRLPAGPSAASPEPGSAVLSTEQFSELFSSGEVAGTTVLVDGEIEFVRRRGPACFPPELCPMGQLAGSDPAVLVFTRGTPTTHDDERRSEVGGEASQWTWWYAARAPVEGLLVLAVDRRGTEVEFLGIVSRAEGAIAWHASSAADLDPVSVSLGDVLVVDGWLHQVPADGADCPTEALPGLPGRGCGPAAWLSDGPEPAAHGAGLRVQDNAMYLARGDAPADEPVAGRYVVARRLYGGCSDVPPCWGWHVVAVLHSRPPSLIAPDIATPALPNEHPPPTASPGASPTPSGSPSPAPSPPATPTTIACTGAPSPPENGAVWMVDHTGNVLGCSVAQAEPADSGITSGFHPPSVTLTWTVPCVSDVQLTRFDFWDRSRGAEDETRPWPYRSPYLLSATRMPPIDTSAGCFTAISGRQVTLLLHAPIAASDVDVVVTEEGRALDRAEQSEHSFQFELESSQTEYTAGQALEVATGLTFERPGASLRISGLLLGIGLEQLDGPLALEPAPSILMCMENGELMAGVPRLIDYRAPETWPAGHPDAGFFEQYTRDGQLVLPPGTYLIYASASFAIGPGCTGDDVALNTAIVITVR